MHATTALPRLPLLAAGLLLALAGPAHAVYKVVGPDGKVTYTDTPPPANSNAKVQSVAVGSGSGSPNLSNLPYELQQAAGKYPVTLYAAPGCRPCDSGRQLLRQRGIPFAEKRLSATPADSEALQRMAGTAELPVLTIGQQQVKGLVASDWHSYLDAAGYPRESKLPASYRAPAATPMTAAVEPAATAPAAEPAAEPAATAPARPASGPNIRF
ncbi:MAG: glutaredoxin domain-containing protein [Pseudomonadota bacterium]